MGTGYTELFKPIEIGGSLFKNRIFGAPHYGGVPFPGVNRHAMHIESLAEEARGGAAQITIGDTMVDPIYGIQPWEPMIASEPVQSMFLGECAAAIKQFGAKAFIELDHPGMFARVPEPIGPVETVRPDGAHVTQMTEDHMLHVAKCFAASAKALLDQGFDGILIHGGHGWLLQQFISPYFNKRTDEYGGSAENRARFPIMVLKEIRKAVGRNMIIEYRVSGDEHIEGGLLPKETAEILQYLEPYLDAVNVSGGLECDPKLTNSTIPSLYKPYGFHLPACAIIKSRLSIPVIAVGAIQSPELADDIIKDGIADAVMLGRPLIADPYLPEKARLGRADEIVPCVRCSCCLGESESKKTFNCSVNPEFLRTYRLRYEYADRPKPRRVLVIGGGVAGMKAALTANERGHIVTLAEKASRLGGNLNFTDHDDIKLDLRAFKNYMVKRVKNSGITLLLETEIAEEDIAAYRPDAIIIATGSYAAVPPIDGIDKPHVSHVLDIYENRASLSGNVVIIGGGLAGCETAIDLAKGGLNVTLLEAEKGFARDAHRMALLAIGEEASKLPNLQYYDEFTVKKITDTEVIGEKKGEEIRYPADHVVYSTGMKPRNDLYLKLYNKAPYVVAIGDCEHPGKIMAANREGYFAAMNIV